MRLSLLSNIDGKGENILGVRNDKGDVHAAAGLNWGYSAGTPILGDAYIPITRKNVEESEGLLPVKSKGENQPIDVIWDDGTKMLLLLEGNGTKFDDNHFYPKQISTYKNKSELGNYIRRRIGKKVGINLVYSQYAIDNLKKIKKDHKGNKEEMIEAIKKDMYLEDELLDKFITIRHLEKYGRTDINIQIDEKGIYRFDFSV